MKMPVIGLAALALAATSGAAIAQSSTIIVTDPPPMARPAAPMAPAGPGVVVVDPADRPATTGAIGETPPGCASTVTRQDAPDGTSTTVRQERCLKD